MTSRVPHARTSSGDPETGVTIADLQRAHVPAVAQLHAEALAGDFLPTLGPAFLRTMYDGMLALGLVFGFVAMDGSEVFGVIVGTTDGRALFRRLAGRRFVPLAWRVTRALLGQPSLIRQTLETFLYPSKEGANTPPAELLFIAVNHAHRGRGIGEALVARLEEAMRARGVLRYKVTVLQQNERANRFYRRLGFERRSQFRLYGKTWNLHVRE